MFQGIVKHGGLIPPQPFFLGHGMIKREARISGDEDFEDWMSFGEGLTYCETARRMANWYFLFKKASQLPMQLDVYVRDVGSKTQFIHTVKLSLAIEVIPHRNDDAEEYLGVTCVVCGDVMPANWDYAACKKCGEEFAYDFVEDDRNFDAANGR